MLTGLDVYTTREPCALCAMACVHSRIRRVVYAAPGGGADAGLEALGLFDEARLNHRFEAWRLGLFAERPPGVEDGSGEGGG